MWQMRNFVNFLFYQQLLLLLGIQIGVVNVLGAGPNYPKSLKGWNMAFNDDTELREIDPRTGRPGNKKFKYDVYGNAAKNSERFNALAKVIEFDVHKKLEAMGLYRIKLNPNDPYGRTSFVFCTQPDLRNVTKLLILIHGSGEVRAGEWSRSLIINESLQKGSQLPYIRQGIQHGYDVLVMNTNDHYRYNKQYNTKLLIPGSETAEIHAQSVWNVLIATSTVQNIAIVAHSYGGVVTTALAAYAPRGFLNRVSAVAFTDSVHDSYQWDRNTVLPILKPMARNWVRSDKKKDVNLNCGAQTVDCVSAGHKKHEWTSWAARYSVFKFIDEKTDARARWLARGK